VIWVAVRALLDELFGPLPVREARVEVFLGLRSGQGVEVGYAADDQTLTFQLDG
jgi:hypothetical protein